MKLKTLAAGLFAAGLCSTVSAAPILTLPLTGTFEDDNIEYVVDAQGQVKTSGQLEVGDTLWATVGFAAIRNPNNTLFQRLGIGQDAEVTGISALRIVDITGDTITFGADPTFEAAWGTGALAAVFVDFDPDFDVGCAAAGVPSDCFLTANNGTHWLTAGLGSATDGWIATAGDIPISTPIEDISAANAATKVATANYGLSVLTNNTGYEFGLQPCLIGGMAQICGSGDVLGGAGLGEGWLARSDFDFNFVRAVQVPLPGTAALLGLGFVAAGWASRRRAK